MIRVYQVKCAPEESVEKALLKKCKISKKDLLSWSIYRKSIDARGQKVLFSYIIDCEIKNENKLLKLKNNDFRLPVDETYHLPASGNESLSSRPVVVGFGPAGMFAALILAQAGYSPIILERGQKVDQRKETVEAFWNGGGLNEESNVQFGEGGAGAFSDGKLTTRSKDPRSRKVLEELVHFGADPEILIDAHPHIGTDAFLPIIKTMRKEIERLGGTFVFEHALRDFEVKDSKLVSVDGQACDVMVLACGHSASDTLRLCHQKGVALENKPFAVGVRIEHTQEYINKAMYKEAWPNDHLMPARYQLTHTASNSKGVYSFCMCPGGYVIPSSSAKELLVINGMSYASRAGINANSALLVQVNESDYGNELFAGLKYQENLEKKAFGMAGSYKACAQLASDYLEHKVSTEFKEVKPTYARGVTMVDLNTLFSSPVNQALHEALKAFERRVPGFVKGGAILSAVESRSSAAVRFVRDEHLMSNIQGLYPCGEGSGYAGGIMTSAIDGIRVAESIICKYAKPMLK